MNHNFEKFKRKVEQLLNHYNANNYIFVIQQVNILLKKQPKNQFILNLLGSSHHKLGNLDIAKKVFLHVIQLEQNNLAAKNNLANVYKDALEFNEAESLYQKILAVDPNYINTIGNYGSLKYQLNQFDEAIALYKRALQINTKSLITHYNLGLAYQSLGKFDEAKSSFNEVLKIDPNMHIVDRMVSRFIKYSEDNPHLISMLEKIKEPNLNDESKINLNFALGKAYEDLLDFKKSFFYLESGNKIKNKISKYNSSSDDRLLKDTINIFRDYNFNKIENINNSHKQIIFIVGLPRSGTSLIEQILSSHSKIYGAGELNFLEELIRKNFHIDNYFKLPDLTDPNNLNLFSTIRKKYLELINKFKAEEHIITDKALLNFRWIGLIKLLFPNAKIVHCIRDPKDNCLSLYKNIFDENQNWTYNQTDILNYFKNYKTLMNFWNLKIPNFIYECKYEDIINNPNIETDKLIKFCDVDWEDQCLEFYKSKRAIKTVSVAQARKPLYKTSISSNKNFEPYLKGLFSNLDNFSS
jgi:tetratricopeptide (TPR) repeat protein